MPHTLSDIAERRRLRTLEGYGVLDTPDEPAFDAIVQQVCARLDVPIALVSLVDVDRQWFKARAGLGATQTPRCISFCTHALHGRSVFVIPDAREDPRFAGNPLVTGDPFIRFYAGAPLVAPNGSRIGTLCAIDREARAGLTIWQEAVLTTLAARVMELVERRAGLSGAATPG